MKNVFFPDEQVTTDDLYFVCYMIERVARQLKQPNCYVANTVGHDELAKKLSLADKLRFFNIAQGSLEECRYYIVLAHDVGYYTDAVANDLWGKIEEASIVLNAYCKAVRESKEVSDE